MRFFRNELATQWEHKKQELDKCCDLKYFEQDADELNNWIRNQLKLISSRMDVIGGDEQEAQNLLNDHIDFASSVRVNYFFSSEKRLFILNYNGFF